MGWLLRRKKKSIRVSAASSAGPEPGWRGIGVRQVLVLLGCIAGAVLVAAAWRSGERILSRYIAAQPVTAPSYETVRLENVPPWIEPAARQRLQHNALVRLTGTRMSHEPLEQVATALGDEPWISRVERVQRARNGGVIIHAEYRRPLALVETPAGYIRVDEQGRELPGAFARGQLSGLGLPVIVGVASPAPGPGLAWPGDDLAGGLQMVKTLAAHSHRHRVAIIDVNGWDRHGSRQIVLTTPDRRIIWGLPPGKGAPIEADTATKLHRLSVVMTMRVNAGRQPTYDIHGADIFELEPLDAHAALTAPAVIANAR